MHDLRSFPKVVADRVASHLVAAGLLVDDDPAKALAHARFAAAAAPRIAAVREAVGITAYHAGEFAMSLAELRAARRIDGSARHLAVMADAERGLGRPERALAYLSDPAVGDLDDAGRIELLIVASGARRDLGEADAAALLLRAEAAADKIGDWTPRLWYAYAEALLAIGDREGAIRWFTSTSMIDDGGTDAASRVAELENSVEEPVVEEPVVEEPVVDGSVVDGPVADRPARAEESEPATDGPDEASGPSPAEAAASPETIEPAGTAVVRDEPTPRAPLLPEFSARDLGPSEGPSDGDS